MPEEPSAYTLSDITSDPERACLSVARGFGRVTFQDQRDTSPELVRKLQARDVVVFSLHGEVGSAAGDSMFTTAGPIRPDDLSQHPLSGQTPEQAMFLTRRELWRSYASDDPAQRLWRAFPFRVYRLH